MKILIADDSPTTRFAVRKNLEEWGYHVLEAVDGQEALELLFQEDPPRIAVLDWMMPKLDGIDVCRELRKRENGPFIYMILLTSKNDPEALAHGLESGAHNFQSKPYSPVELRSHIMVGKRLVEADDKLKEYAAEMERLAITDPLTGVNNRRRFLECGNTEIRRSRRYYRPLSVLLMDVDFFKKINDGFGHAAGDETLRMITKTCLAGLRENDVFGRLGGEEFGVLLPESDMTDACEAAERIRASIEKLRVRYEKNEIRVTISIGVTGMLSTDENIDMILNRADKALYTAKEEGRNQVVALRGN